MAATRGKTARRSLDADCTLQGLVGGPYDKQQVYLHSGGNTLPIRVGRPGRTQWVGQYRDRTWVPAEGSRVA